MANRNASSQLCLLSPLMRKTSRNHHGDEADHQPGELVDAQIEAGQLALPDDTGGQRSKVGPVPGVDDHGRRGAALHVGAQEAEVGKFQRILNVGRRRGGFLLHRQGFAGEGRLIQEQVFGGKHPHVSRHHIAGGQPDDIAGHQHLERDFFFLAVSHQCRRVADHRLELLGRVIGTHLLEETQHHAQNHHHENDHRRPQVTG
jgi:hypothetical protein